MQVRIIEGLLHPGEAKRAEQVLNACVHCGFCTATCPTYLQAGNELDSPRGRIYLIKEMLETGEATQVTRTHLDRCLTCLSCETTCPSGVEYHKLVAVGRATSERLAPRGAAQKSLRFLLRKLMVTPALFPALMAIGRPFAPLLPAVLRRVYFPPRTAQKKSPEIKSGVATNASDSDAGKVLLVKGCVQPTLRPETDVAFIRILTALEVPVEESAAANCCGAASFHTSGEGEARSLARAQVDYWWQRLTEEPIRAIVSTASGCGVHLKDYGTVLADDPDYRHKAEEIVRLIRDPVEVMEEVLEERNLQLTNAVAANEFVFHCPCTLQHGQGLNGRVERLLGKLGFRLPVVEDAHLCCGSAGTYSVLQPSMSRALREEKLQRLQASNPDTILTANIGCQLHLQGGTETPVRHWLEIVADVLENAALSERNA
ncbi:Anaerobic glycerol-3-phosphate dehydrogenase subunit C [Microbulbifer aggregans]|uniref:Glycolate oxidase iron-sulfur subunit n=1 Tax=Microbulbifer aggregans TaxID=1769779 RepID=A0A1C9WAM1_9GAMM|nr:glycolate oxidase subunit GlcF [Microbulbifer aggregans]AOS98202.1 Anaerobic glycerol-3-phosphate dehydrogenase subunit C [Microbulbifer aggregans]